jgi:hypothetical protein
MVIGQLALFDGVQLSFWTKAQLYAVPLACPLRARRRGEWRGITARNGRNVAPRVAERVCRSLRVVVGTFARQGLGVRFPSSPRSVSAMTEPGQ